MSIKKYLSKGKIHFLTSTTMKKKRIFIDRNATQFLVTCIAYQKYMLDFRMFGYVVMPEHFHIMIQPGDKYDLSKIMKLIKGNYARKYNEFHALKGYLWQEGFKDTLIDNEEEFNYWLEYMHTNPVKARLVKGPEDYEFSSFHQYHGKARKYIQIPIDLVM